MDWINLHRPTAFSLARKLLQIQAVRLSPQEPFLWSSGLKSPIYCDNRLTLSYPDLRTYVKRAMVEVIRIHFSDVEYIAGVATAGIPQGAMVADSLGLPYVYVRPAPKSHGMKNQVEGRVEAGKRVVLIEDLVSTGGSTLAAASALADKGFNPIGAVALFTYGLDAAARQFEAKELPLVSLSNFESLLEVAEGDGLFDPQQLDRLKSWMHAPEAWS